MHRILVGLTVLAVLSGCQSAPKEKPHDELQPRNLPEYRAYLDCLAHESSELAAGEGSPLELGIIGAAACEGPRQALYGAVMRSNGAAYTHGFSKSVDASAPTMVAERIVLNRRDRKG